jgi:rhodanese-related sulfurtransferase
MAITTAWRVGAAIALMGLGGCMPDRVEQEAAQPVQTAGPRFVSPLVSPEALQERIANGEDVLIVDVRTRDAFDQEHIPGAVSRPKLELISGLPRLPMDRPVALYCTCPNDESSALGAHQLHLAYGHKNLLVLHGGMDAWKEAGYKTVVKPGGRSAAR